MIIDILLIAFSALFLIFSYKNGFLKRCNSFFSLILSITACYFIYSYLNRFHFKNNLNKIFILFIIFIILYIILKIIINLIAKNISQLPIIGKTDKLLGIIIGLLQIALFTVFISFLINSFSKQLASQSKIVHFISQLFNF